eukprot:TRINITY_DN948_c0_g3_i1.p1 TRINITY_DN948_c0_g3~~TRINITY_DN948_c0_g3_i1.p1  ORF type:complete len:547 (+),score=84.48 TRINITY_DN948_c0_g3_i1:124-1764(+)
MFRASCRVTEERHSVGEFGSPSIGDFVHAKQHRLRPQRQHPQRRQPQHQFVGDAVNFASIDTPSPNSGSKRIAGGSGNNSARYEESGGNVPHPLLKEVLRRQGIEEAWNLLEHMQQNGISTNKYIVSRMLMKTIGDSKARQNPSRIYRSIAIVERFVDTQPKDVDEVLFNALLDTCCRLKDMRRLEATVNRMRELKVTPSPVTLGILVKAYGQAGDLSKVLQSWDEMEVQRAHANAVTYGCMIDACVKCGNLDKAVSIFKEMREQGRHKNTILYTTLIKGYGLKKDLDNALALFREMEAEGVPYNTITYNSAIDACVKCNDMSCAEELLGEMMQSESSLAPDLITFSTILKGYCNDGDLDKALEVAEAINSRGFRCDELVYNTLMDGCVKAGEIKVGIGLFDEMVQGGLRPSAVTHSILIRLYQSGGCEDDAVRAVTQLYEKHGIDRPPNVIDRSRGASLRQSLSKPSACQRISIGDALEVVPSFQPSPTAPPPELSLLLQLGLGTQATNVDGLPAYEGVPIVQLSGAPHGACAAPFASFDIARSY